MKKCRFYFHFRSPYSWVGALWMEKLRDARDVQYVPFWELDAQSRSLLAAGGGEHYYTPMSKAKHLYILQDVKRITARLGLQLTWPPSPEQQHWEVPHLAYLYARREGKDRAFFRQVHEARWLQGENICDPAVIARIAAACGLSETRTAHAHEDPSIREESAAEMMLAYEDGVFGIPFFVHGYDKFWGIDRFPLFLQSLRKASSDAALPAPAELPADWPYYETDHPGGCG